MILKSDARFEEKMTCSFKYDTRNLLIFLLTTQKSDFLMGFFVQSIQDLSYKSTEVLPFITLNSDVKFEQILTLWFQKWREELGELSLEHSKV